MNATAPRAVTLTAVSDRQRHAHQADLLRRVLEAFPVDEDETADRAVRRYAEGAIKANELAATQRDKQR